MPWGGGGGGGGAQRAELGLRGERLQNPCPLDRRATYQASGSQQGATESRRRESLQTTPTPPPSAAAPRSHDPLDIAETGGR